MIGRKQCYKNAIEIYNLHATSNDNRSKLIEMSGRKMAGDQKYHVCKEKHLLMLLDTLRRKM